MNEFKIRTDLAVEARERFEGDDIEISGVVLKKSIDEQSQVKITRVEITDKNGERAMGKPMGKYITLESEKLQIPDENYHREVSKVLAEHIMELLPKGDMINVLVVGLGNINATPDALGPMTINNLRVNRHIVKEYGMEADNKRKRIVSSIIPGVMAQTGMESLEIISAIVKETTPDAIIVVDSLAAGSTHRVNTTIQISDTGINPGAGVGNCRMGINEKSVGVPVIAIGVPTVVDAATIVNDTMDNLLEFLQNKKELKQLSDALSELNHTEKYYLIRELIEPHIGTMYVTPKDIDESIKMLSFTISEGINIALCQD
ncbi:MAG: GPR endopeptidase [Eubacterium sp.]